MQVVRNFAETSRLPEPAVAALLAKMFFKVVLTAFFHSLH